MMYSHRRASILQWNPEVATQLVVASDDDRSPTLQMWDLRNSVSPLKEFVGHGKVGVGIRCCLCVGGVGGEVWGVAQPDYIQGILAAPGEGHCRV